MLLFNKPLTPNRASTIVTVNLEKIFSPKSIAVIGASDEECSVGYALMKKLAEVGYEDKVYPVNIHKPEILGVVRLIIEPDGKNGEIAFIVADPWQGLGLGAKMVDYMIEICKDKKLETVYAFMLPDNHRAIRLLGKMGFTIEHTQDVTKVTLNLKE